MATVQEKMNGEYMQSLYRAFIKNKADFIIVDGRSGEFLRNCANFGLDERIICFDEMTSRNVSDSQWEILAYRLTESGRKRLGALN